MLHDLNLRVRDVVLRVKDLGRRVYKDYCMVFRHMHFKG